MENQPSQQTVNFGDVCEELRTKIKDVADSVLNNKNVAAIVEPIPAAWDRPEMLANLMLAYRHLEDARMRMGKVLQAINNGKSVYDK